MRLAILGASPPSPPQITNTPASQTNVAGANVTFRVGVSSATTPGCQWRFNGAKLTGKTASTLTLNNVRTNQTGDYTVVVTNASGVAVTGAPPAHLLVMVTAAPLLTLQPSAASEFRFAFTPVVGLTNTMLTNAEAASAG